MGDICPIVILSSFEFIISIVTFTSTENKAFWVFRIINSLLFLVLSFCLCDATTHRYQDGAAPILAILPCSVIIFVISELGNLIILTKEGLFPQTERYIYILHFIILILYFLILKSFN